MANIINTKVSEGADLKIEDSVIRDSSIGDYTVVYITEESKLHDVEIQGNALIRDSEIKYAKLNGNVEIKHSTIEGCTIKGENQFVNCFVKRSVINNVNIINNKCTETIENGEVYVPVGFVRCDVMLKDKATTVTFQLVSNTWIFKKRKLIDFIRDYFEL